MADYGDRQKQEQRREASRRVYSTRLIDQFVKDCTEGYDIDYSPFFNRELDLRAPNVTFMMTEEEVEEYQKCYDDPEYFIERYCKFQTDDGWETIQLRDFQRNVIDVVTDEVYDPETDRVYPTNRNVIWMASRQTGKTTTISSFMAWMINFHIDRNVLIVANKDKTAKEIVSKIKSIFRGLPFFLKPGCEKFNESEIILDNGSKILSSATTNTASIGFTIHCILLDEFAHVPENIVNNFWRSVYPTLSSSKVSQCIITSTPNGTTNKFYDIWSKSIEGKNSFVHLRTDYWEVPGHDEAWAAEQRANFGEEEFAQEFELQFNKNSKMLIKTTDLEFIKRLSRDFVHVDFGDSNQYLQDEHIVWHPDFDPKSIDKNDKFVFLIDLAEGNGDPDAQFKSKSKEPDYNTIDIMKVVLNSPANVRRYADESCAIEDAVRFIQVGKWSSNTEDEVYCAKVASALAYNLFHDDVNENVRIAVEMNFNGKAFTERFKMHPSYYDGTIVRTYHTKPVPGERQRKRLGMKTTANKEYYCQKGNRLMHKKRIISTDTASFQQIQAFGYVKGKLKGIGCHDDLSMPLFNHIPKILEEPSFKAWIDEFVQNCKDTNRKYAINQIIQTWEMDNPEMDDKAFNAMYGLDGNVPGMLGYQNSEMSYVGAYMDGNATNPYTSSTPMYGGMLDGNMNLLNQ